MCDRGELPEAPAHGLEHVPSALRGRAEEHEGEEKLDGRSETTRTPSSHTAAELNAVSLVCLLQVFCFCPIPHMK